MSEQPPTRADKGRTWEIPALLWGLLVAGVFYVCLFSHLGALGLVGPDEPRYASVAREMAESGDWVTPRLDGEPWFEKPVLYYWGAAPAFRLFGVNEFAARLPSALAAALTALALAVAARRLSGELAARAILLMLPTCVGVVGFARAAAPDMLFSGTLTAAMVAASVALGIERGESALPGRRRNGALVAFGAFLGAAALAKGPAAIVLAGGSAGLWVLATRRWREFFWLLHPLALLAFCLAALPWYALCAARNPEFVRAFLLQHNIERYLTPVFRHQQPLWFFGPVLLLGLLPWTALLAEVARNAVPVWREKRWTDSAGVFFACWVIFPVAFFSFSKSKLPGYVLPALPPLALLLARSAAGLIGEKAAFGRWAFALVGGTFVALAASAGYWLRRLPVESGLADPKRAVAGLTAGYGLKGLVAIAAIGGLVVAWLGLQRRLGAALLGSVLLMAALIEIANRQPLPHLDVYLSPRAAARAAGAHPGAVESLSVYRLHRAWHYGLNFYLHRKLPEWDAQSPPPRWLFTSRAGAADLQQRGMGFAVVERSSPQAWLLRLTGKPENPAGGNQP